jgi:hypothetical protein
VAKRRPGATLTVGCLVVCAGYDFWQQDVSSGSDAPTQHEIVQTVLEVGFGNPTGGDRFDTELADAARAIVQTARTQCSDRWAAGCRRNGRAHKVGFTEWHGGPCPE